MWGFLSSMFGNGGDSIKVGEQSPLPNKRTTSVNFDEAMTVSACWASTRLLTETVAAMPIQCFDRDLETNVKSPKADYELFRLLNYRPNRYQTRTEFIEQIMINLVSWGNSYCVVERLAGKIVSLMPLAASQMEVELLFNGDVVYKYTTADGSVRVYAESTIWHVKLFGNGIVGLSPLGYASNSIGIAIDQASRMGELSANGGKTNGILTCDNALKDDQRAQIKEAFAGLQEGNQAELFVLEAGFTYQQASLSPTDMQLLESRRFSIEDIARFYGVPSVLINDTASGTTWGSGIFEINMGFYKLNLKPYLERIESSIKRHLMPSTDWDTVDIEFNFDSLLRADKTTRLESQAKAVNAGLLMPNEGRAEEGLPPEKGGSQLYLNGTLVPAGTVQRQTQAIPNDGT
jgi:HK97 family phage portal protein